MGNRREYIIRGIVDICSKLDQKGFVANHDGNVTAKFEDGFLATPTAEAKAAITPEMILDLDKEGKIFFETVYNLQKKRIFNALKNSSSDSVIKFKEVLKKIIDGK